MPDQTITHEDGTPCSEPEKFTIAQMTKDHMQHIISPGDTIFIPTTDWNQIPPKNGLQGWFARITHINITNQQATVELKGATDPTPPCRFPLEAIVKWKLPDNKPTPTPSIPEEHSPPSPEQTNIQSNCTTQIDTATDAIPQTKENVPFPENNNQNETEHLSPTGINPPLTQVTPENICLPVNPSNTADNDNSYVPWETIQETMYPPANASTSTDHTPETMQNRLETMEDQLTKYRQQLTDNYDKAQEQLNTLTGKVNQLQPNVAELDIKKLITEWPSGPANASKLLKELMTTSSKIDPSEIPQLKHEKTKLGIHMSTQTSTDSQCSSNTNQEDAHATHHKETSTDNPELNQQETSNTKSPPTQKNKVQLLKGDTVLIPQGVFPEYICESEKGWYAEILQTNVKRQIALIHFKEGDWTDEWYDINEVLKWKVNMELSLATTTNNNLSPTVLAFPDLQDHGHIPDKQKIETDHEEATLAYEAFNHSNTSPNKGNLAREARQLLANRHDGPSSTKPHSAPDTESIGHNTRSKRVNVTVANTTDPNPPEPPNSTNEINSVEELMDDITTSRYALVFDCSPTSDEIIKRVNVAETMCDQMGLKKESCKATIRTFKDDQEEKVRITVITPTSRREAKAQPEWPEWYKAEVKEMLSQHKNVSWAIVELPPGRKLVKSGWVYKIKLNSDGSISKYKCRLVCKGYSQEYGLDYNETFAPSIQRSTLRLLLAIGAAMGWPVWENDVETAFLNAPIEEEMYMEQPLGHEVRDSEGKVKKGPNGKKLVCRLISALYGTKQAGRNWFKTFIKPILMFEGTKQCDVDTCLFICERGDSILFIGINVDNLFTMSNDEHLRKSFIDSLDKHFILEELGLLKWSLGMQVNQNLEEGYTTIDQSLFIENTLKEYNWWDKGKICTKNIPCPVENEIESTPLPIANSQEQKDMNQYPVRSAACKFLYAAENTRPDIKLACAKLSRSLHNPGQVHWKALKHLAGYLRNTVNYGIVYTKLRSDQKGVMFNCLLAFADADWAGDPNDRKSRSGWVIYCAGGPIAWLSKLQPTVALSSTEAEIGSAITCVMTILSLRKILKYCGFTQQEATILMEDNLGCIATANDPILQGKIKHMQIKQSFLRDYQDIEEIKLQYIESTKQIADGLTKPLAMTPFTAFRNSLVRDVLNISINNLYGGQRT